MPPPEPRPQIFISHSAREGLPRRVRDSLAARLTEEGFDVRMDDKDVEWGDASWRSTIDGWVRECDSACLLLDSRAAHSPYVFSEVTLLRQRALMHAEVFRLLILRFPDVGDDLLNGRLLSPLQLGEFQQLRVDPAAPLAVDPAEVVELLRPTLERRKPRTEIEKRLINLLFLCCPPECLQGLGAELSLPAGPPGIKKDRCIAVARALLDGAGEPLGPGRFERLTRVLRSLQPLLDTAKCQEVVNRVAPFCWVNPDAAASLRASADEPGGAVAWRRQWPLSEPMYLRRAFCSPDVFPVWVSDAGAWGGGLEHGLAHLRSCLLRRLGLPEGATDESIRRALELWRRSGRRVCLVMPLASVDAPLLGQARRCWPSSCFFLHDPNLTRPAFEQYGFDSVRFLEPELTAEAEYDARVSWTGLMLEAGADEGHVYSGEAYS